MNRFPKLAVNVGFGFSEPMPTLMRYVKDAGFDGCFFIWAADQPVAEWVAAARKIGLDLPFLHGPFRHVDAMWENGEEGELHVQEECDCIAECARLGIPLVVLHCMIGFDKHSPNALGISRFRRVAEFAADRGVALAFENTEGAEYLAAVMEGLSDMPNVGFCYDNGHAMCYNRDIDLPALYDDRIYATHLNDNMGQTLPSPYKTDDAHMLPFDGVADWDAVVAAIRPSLWRLDFLTLELRRDNKPGRHTHDRYAAWDAATFYQNAYERAVRIRQML